VAWVAAESRHGWELALEWIESKKEHLAITGWATLSSLVAIKDDDELDMAEVKRLLQRVQRTLPKAPDRVRYVMNGFVIAVGTYVQPLTDFALQTARKIGEVSVDVGETSCKVPYAPEYIEKIQPSEIEEVDDNTRGSDRLMSLDALRVSDMYWITGGDALVQSRAEFYGTPFLAKVGETHGAFGMERIDTFKPTQPLAAVTFAVSDSGRRMSGRDGRTGGSRRWRVHSNQQALGFAQHKIRIHERLVTDVLPADEALAVDQEDAVQRLPLEVVERPVFSENLELRV
jgi:hypothetical protein